MRSSCCVAALMTASILFPLRAMASEPDQTEAFRDATTDWKSPLLQSLAGRTVVVVETAEPQRRLVCHVRDARADALVCSSKFHRDVALPVAGILAVLELRDGSAGRVEATTAAVGAALITAGFFAGPAAPALWILGGLVLLAVPAEAMGDNGPFHDRVLYFAPGPQPILHLR